MDERTKVVARRALEIWQRLGRPRDSIGACWRRAEHELGPDTDTAMHGNKPRPAAGPAGDMGDDIMDEGQNEDDDSETR